MPRGQRLPRWPIQPGHPDWPTCKCGCGESVGAHHRGIVAKGILNGQPHEYRRGHTGRAQPWRNGQKRCATCEQFKDPSAFRVKSTGSLTRDCAACLDVLNSAWRARNQTRLYAQQRVYRETNAEMIRARIKAWREKNPDKARALSRGTSASRRARKKAQFVEHVDHRVVYKRDEGICGICLKAVEWRDLEVDHIVPMCRGGLHAYANVRATHKACNQWKGDRLDEEIGLSPDPHGKDQQHG